MTERVELLDDVWIDLPEGWYTEREGDTALVLADAVGEFVTNLFVHETESITPDQLVDGVTELPGGIVLTRRVVSDGRHELRFGYATDGESLTGVRLLVERADAPSLLVHATMATRRLRADGPSVDRVLDSIGAR